MAARRWVAALLATSLLSASVVAASLLPSPQGTGATIPAVTLIGAGDIASCSSSGDEQTAEVLDRFAGTVFTTGDNAYPDGALWQFRTCYKPSWGRHKARTRPTAGNHEYKMAGAVGYFAYFGSAAGDPDRGWYAYNRGAWRIYALNSNCAQVHGCWVGSPQERWLRADLAAHPRACVMAYWHHPLFSSGKHGNQPQVRGLWKALHAAGAEIVVNGHDHSYERFAPQDWQATADPQGIREFVVGTGGRSHYARVSVQTNSQAWDDTSFGVLKLVLGDGWYRWRFLAAGSGTFRDSGTGDCQ